MSDVDIAFDTDIENCADISESDSEEYQKLVDSNRNIKNDRHGKQPGRGYFTLLEPMIFLHIVGYGALEVTLKTYVVNQVSRSIGLQCKTPTCQLETSDSSLEEIIQRTSTHIVMCQTILETSFQILYAMFLGGWIEKHGCKPSIVLSLIGFTISAFILFFLSLANSVPPYAILLASIPIGLGGGPLAFSVSYYSYVTRITTFENRSFRLALLKGASFLGMPVGLQLGSQVLRLAGFSELFLFCGCIQVIALLYSLFLKSNTRSKEVVSTKSKTDIFDMKAFGNITKIFTHHKPGARPLWIILIYISTSIRIFIQEGHASVSFLYTMLILNWTEVEFSNYKTVAGILNFTGLAISSFIFMKCLKLKDTTLGVLASFSVAWSYFIWSLAVDGWMIYFSAVVHMLSGVMCVLTRSSLSKLVATNQVSAAFVLVGIVDSICVLASAPVYAYIYTNTLAVAPNSVFLLSASLGSIMVVIFLYLCVVVPGK